MGSSSLLNQIVNMRHPADRSPGPCSGHVRPLLPHNAVKRNETSSIEVPGIHVVMDALKDWTM